MLSDHSRIGRPLNCVTVCILQRCFAHHHFQRTKDRNSLALMQ